MIITWYGTASIGISHGTEDLLFDPYVKYCDADFTNSIADFTNSKNIFVTHGHFDHSQYVPAIIKKTQAKVYCTVSPAATMLRNQVPKDLIVSIKPDDTVEINGFRIRVLPGRHIKFDFAIIAATLLNIRVIKYWRNFKDIIRLSLKYPEKAETVIYLIEGNGKKILIMGSLGLKEKQDYPADV
ncbi:MAG TPA: MBL fold metallo-hydrolase, partial [Smithellaceae bacterium]|nr:MBL fold metallo-hydrolase [Smithellaceae bacterium]